MATPVTLYLNLRDQFSDPVLLESNDSRTSENSWSFLGLETLASFRVQRGRIRETYPGEPVRERSVESPGDFVANSICLRDVDARSRRHQHVDLNKLCAPTSRNVARVIEEAVLFHDAIHDFVYSMIQIAWRYLQHIGHGATQADQR